MENKRRHKIFQAPSGCLSERLLKCLLKRWFVCGSATMWPCQHVSRSSAWPVTCESVPWKGFVYTCGAWQLHPKATHKKNICKHILNPSHTCSSSSFFIIQNVIDKTVCLYSSDICCMSDVHKKKKKSQKLTQGTKKDQMWSWLIGQDYQRSFSMVKQLSLKASLKATPMVLSTCPS